MHGTLRIESRLLQQQSVSLCTTRFIATSDNILFVSLIFCYVVRHDTIFLSYSTSMIGRHYECMLSDSPTKINIGIGWR